MSNPGDDVVILTTEQLKWYLMRLIGNSIDETSIGVGNSFVEMDEGVIHYAGDNGDRYFKVTLEETTESHYFDPLIGAPLERIVPDEFRAKLNE
jgi:hypothetical protein